MTKKVKKSTHTYPKLSIVIPTRNREMHVDLLLQNLQNLFSGYDHKIQIVVSDNSDVPISFTAIAPNVHIVRPEKLLATAEENLFFALSKCTGEFVWPLGDDDIPQKEGIAALLKFLSNPLGDWAVFNYGVIDFKGVLRSSKLLKSSKPEVNFLYSDFVSIVGYQTTAACLSLTIFRRSLVTTNQIKTVQKFISPIYSHVALYLLSFGNRRGLFIDTPLVNYRNNRQATSSRDDNWVKWSQRNKTPYRYPWTVGLIEQLNYLVEVGIIKPDFPIVFLETNHFGVKFSGLHQMISYVIDQIRRDEKLNAKYRFSPDDKIVIAEFLLRYAPQHTYLIEALQSGLSKRYKVSGAKFTKHKFLLSAYIAVTQRFVFSHAAVRFTNSGIFFRVPMGYMYLSREELNYLGMLEGVDFFDRKAWYFDGNLDSLISKVRSRRDTSAIKPNQFYSFSNFEALTPEKKGRFLSLARKLRAKLT